MAEINITGIWYHGSNLIFSELKEGSTITPWQELAEAFSHKLTRLEYDDDRIIRHNGNKKGYLYVIDEPIEIEKDIYQHPNSKLDTNAEFLTKRPLKVKLIKELPKPAKSFWRKSKI